MAAQILKGKKVATGGSLHSDSRTQLIYLEAMEEGLIETFIEAEAAVSTPDLRPVPRRSHGDSCSRRVGCGYDKPQLRGPNGTCG